MPQSEVTLLTHHYQIQHGPAQPLAQLYEQLHKRRPNEPAPLMTVPGLSTLAELGAAVTPPPK
eukprot:2563550-Amphidinium_carterae.1